MKFERIKKKLFSKFGIYLALIILSCLLVELFSATSWFRQLENQTEDWRFRLRGQLSPSSDLVLVLIDEPTQQNLGTLSPYPRQIFAILAYGLAQMGVKTIGFDFRFNEPRLPATDSLLVDVTREVKSIVYGYHFQQIYENAENVTDSIVHTGLASASRTPFYQADEQILPFPALSQVCQHSGHLNVLVEELNGAIRKVPLMLSCQATNYPAFALEMIKAFRDISDTQIEIQPEKLLLHVPVGPPMAIPISEKGEFRINYTGELSAFANTLSLVDVLVQCQAIISQDTLPPPSPIFKDKMVLIGSLVDEDVCLTPFSVTYPGVLIHATVIQNILQQQFLRTESRLFQIGKLIFLALLIGFVFLKLRFWQKFFALGLIFLAVSLFSWFALVWSGLMVALVQPLVFVGISVTCFGIRDLLTVMRMNVWLREKLADYDLRLAALARPANGITAKPHFIKLIIPLLQFADQYFIPHAVETNWEHTNDFEIFQKGFQTKHLLPIKDHQINKLQFDLNQLWQDYAAYCLNHEKPEPRPIDKLRRLGSIILRDFGLKATLNQLFQLNQPELYLNLVLNDLRIPWLLAYDSNQNLFFSEKLPTGISLATEKNFQAHPVQSAIKTDDRLKTQKAAILFYGDWKEHQSKALNYIQLEIGEIGKKLFRYGAQVCTIQQEVGKFLDELENCIESQVDLRLIHYSGHAQDGYLDVGENHYLPPGILKGSRDLFFASRPLVFLNACQSGNYKDIGQKCDQLATEFLACGAGACVVTCLKVFEVTAARFSVIFYKYFIDQGLMVGEALRLTQLELGQTQFSGNLDPNYDLTRYFYLIYGDPTLTF